MHKTIHSTTGALPLSSYLYVMQRELCKLTHSSPSGRFRPGKIADFSGLVDHVCALLKIDIAIGLYLCSLLQKTEPIYHIYNSF